MIHRITDGFRSCNLETQEAAEALAAGCMAVSGWTRVRHRGPQALRLDGQRIAGDYWLWFGWVVHAPTCLALDNPRQEGMRIPPRGLWVLDTSPRVAEECQASEPGNPLRYEYDGKGNQMGKPIRLVLMGTDAAVLAMQRGATLLNPRRPRNAWTVRRLGVRWSDTMDGCLFDHQTGLVHGPA